MPEAAQGMKLYAFIRTTYNKRNEREGNASQPHRHPYFQLIFGRVGEGAVIVEGTDYPIKENDVILVGRNELHHFRADSEKFKTYEIKFDLPPAESSRLGNIRLLAEDTTGSIRRALKQIEFEAKQADDLSHHIALLELCKILELLRRACQPSRLTGEHNTEGGEGREDDLFIRIRGYIDRHVSEGTTIGDISREFCMEYKYLSRLFSKRYGIHLKRYINRRRIEHASDLIATTDMNMSQIAEQSGFSTLHHMERAFREILGVSPSAYRNNFQHSYAVSFDAFPDEEE